jgi:hypothetical protein
MSQKFPYKNYDRTHGWKFEGGIVVKASAAPEYLGKKNLYTLKKLMQPL